MTTQERSGRCFLAVLLLVLVAYIPSRGQVNVSGSGTADRHKPVYTTTSIDLGTLQTNFVLLASESGVLTGISARVIDPPAGFTTANLVITVDGQATTFPLYSSSTTFAAPAADFQIRGTGDGDAIGDLVHLPFAHGYRSSLLVQVAVTGGSGGTLSLTVVRGQRF